MNPATAFARVWADELVRNGVTEAVLSPGSRSTPLVLALAEQPGLRLHVRIDERSAGFVALGLARVTGRPAVVVCTSGTAGANLFPAVIEAAESGVGLLICTADRPPELRGTGANQTIDQVGLYGGAVRWFAEVGVPEVGAGAGGGGAAAAAAAVAGRRAEDVGCGGAPPRVPSDNAYWRSLVSRAVAETGALGHAPGPVHLNCALREPLIPGDDDPAGLPPGLVGRVGGVAWTQVVSAPPSAGDIEASAALLADAQRGVLMVGDGAFASAEAAQPVIDLAEQLGWPLIAEPTGNARRGPNAISCGALLLGDPQFAAAQRPDLVVTLGKVGLAKSVLGLLAAVPQVVVDPYGRWWDPTRGAAHLAVADPGAWCRAMVGAKGVASRAGAGRGDIWLAGWQAAEARARAAVDHVLDGQDAAAAPSEQRIARDLAAGLPQGALLVVGSSMPIRDLDTVMAPRDGLTVIANRGASGIDGFVSTAIGAALAWPGPTTALCGDLTLLHDRNGLLIGPGEPRPDVVIVVVNNDGGGIFSFLPQALVPQHFERLFGTPHGADLAAVAAASGCGYRRLDSANGLFDAVGGAHAAGGVQLIEIRTDRATNTALHAAVTAAVRGTTAR